MRPGASAYQVDTHGADDGEADADGGGQLLGGKVDRALAHLLAVVAHEVEGPVLVAHRAQPHLEVARREGDRGMVAAVAVLAAVNIAVSIISFAITALNADTSVSSVVSVVSSSVVSSSVSFCSQHRLMHSL